MQLDVTLTTDELKQAVADWINAHPNSPPFLVDVEHVTLFGGDDEEGIEPYGAYASKSDL